MADRSQLRQLLENCFRNSLEHGTTSPGPADPPDDEDAGGLTVRVGSLPDGFFVEDDGPGIPEAERDRVFDRGYSGGQGTGLGLSIVDRIAAGHDWDATVTEAELGGPDAGGDEPAADAAGARFEFRGVGVPGD